VDQRGGEQAQQQFIGPVAVGLDAVGHDAGRNAVDPV
jgi:hypothetical protein